jgi:hypothetical protein
MIKYVIEHKGSEVDVPKDLQNKIVKDHLMNSYHWVFGFAGLIIGFLLGVIAK